MKLVPGPLPPIPTGTTMDRLPLGMPFSPDILWRYPLGFPTMGQPPASPLMDYKSQLPSSLTSDPRLWSREDVVTFLRWAEREYDIQPIDMEMFQMNGKALCLLNRTDLAERAPSSGDVLYNVIQILVREANAFSRILPSSPVTPTSRHPYPMSPHSHPSTPTWNVLAQNNSESFQSSHTAHLAAQLLAHSNSVTLSPAPSMDSQNSSPQHSDHQTYSHNAFSTTGSNGSNPSDSDEEEKKWNQTSPPNTPTFTFNTTYSVPSGPPRSPKEPALSSDSYVRSFGRDFFPNDSPEPNTNGRLLWDFLQQLLNDPAQRYTNHIAWKNRETGVFKIVDPAGLAKLWGIQKNHLSMNYDKMSRALRYYYRVNILKKVQGERHCYQFLRNPTELKNIKNISLLRQQMTISPTNKSSSSQATPPQMVPQITIKPEPTEIQESVRMEYDDKPTDLSMDKTPTDLSSNRHVNIVCSPDPPIHPN